MVKVAAETAEVMAVVEGGAATAVVAMVGVARVAAREVAMAAAAMAAAMAVVATVHRMPPPSPLEERPTRPSHQVPSRDLPLTSPRQSLRYSLQTSRWP